MSRTGIDTRNFLKAELTAHSESLEPVLWGD